MKYMGKSNSYQEVICFNSVDNDVCYFITAYLENRKNEINCLIDDDRDLFVVISMDIVVSTNNYNYNYYVEVDYQPKFEYNDNLLYRTVRILPSYLNNDGRVILDYYSPITGGAGNNKNHFSYLNRGKLKSKYLYFNEYNRYYKYDYNFDLHKYLDCYNVECLTLPNEYDINKIFDFIYMVNIYGNEELLNARIIHMNEIRNFNDCNISFISDDEEINNDMMDCNPRLILKKGVARINNFDYNIEKEMTLI